MAYEIRTVRQGFNVLADSTGAEVAQIHNTVNGWMAQRSEGSRYDQTLRLIGEPVRVSRMINEHNGAAQIAAALGL